MSKKSCIEGLTQILKADESEPFSGDCLKTLREEDRKRAKRGDMGGRKFPNIRVRKVIEH